MRRARKLKEFAENTPVADALDSLLTARYHGAVNIRGIRFQLRYSLLRAVQLGLSARTRVVKHTEGIAGDRLLQFEGIEDVDIIGPPFLKPLHVTDKDTNEHEFIQVKTAAGGWNWSDLGGPL